jgi:ferredoxin-thioredoxin reductase catalytic subunit
MTLLEDKVKQLDERLKIVENHIENIRDALVAHLSPPNERIVNKNPPTLNTDPVKAAIRSVLEQYADESGYVLNPNEKQVDGIIRALIKRKEKYGYQYCPCRVPSGDEVEDKKIVCPCAYHDAEIKETGHCLCKLFYAVPEC